MVSLWAAYCGGPLSDTWGASLKCQFPGPYSRLTQLVYLKIGSGACILKQDSGIILIHIQV